MNMRDSNDWNPRESWRRLRLEAEAAQNYPLSYALYLGQTHRDKLLEQLLPTLLYIKAVAIVDDSLALWLDTNGHNLTKPYREGLYGRLSYLANNGLLEGTDDLHRIRKRRNELAHEPGATCEWDELSTDLLVLEKALVILGLARETGKLDYFSERSALKDSQEPGISFRTFKYGVKEAGRPALEVTWIQKFDES